LKYDFDLSVQKLFENIKKFYLEFIEYHHVANTIPNDPKFPLGSSALYFHYQLMDEFDKVSEEKPITESDIDQIFESTGKIIDPEQINYQLYHAGCNDVLF
jgi:hypothetical protein